MPTKNSMPESTTAGPSFDGDVPAGNNSLVPSATGIRRAAMDWLARREHARREIEQKLLRRFPDATAAIGPVLDELEHEGLLNTARFVENFTRSRVRRGYGPRRITAELRTRGVRSNGEVAESTDEVVPADADDPDAISVPVNVPVDWLFQAREARARRFGDGLPPGPAERNRQMAFLQRRGFPSDICRKACLPPRDED
jgi:regulatory protein